ncbi:MAG: lytic transglycosylase domain-containing protein [Deltaproteobacteria bacterium]|nr:lytic transglycosylase domain-containing protein [Deltaproteobacteria bacterium]
MSASRSAAWWWIAVTALACATPTAQDAASTSSAPRPPPAAPAPSPEVPATAVDEPSAPAVDQRPVTEPADEVAPPVYPLHGDHGIDLGMLPEAGGMQAAKVRDADRALSRSDSTLALEILADVRTPAAYFLKARAFRLAGLFDAATDALSRAEKDRALVDLAALERGLTAAAQDDLNGAVSELLPLVTRATDFDAGVAARAALPLATALAHVDPATLIANADVIREALPKKDPDAMSLFFDAHATAAEAVGDAATAARLRLRRYLEEPLSKETPTEPPAGGAPDAFQLLDRAEKLLEANRNERAIEALQGVAAEGLAPTLRCRKDFGLGLAHRKLHHYATAEQYFTAVTKTCDDGVLVRRAMYLNIKVISIADGLRAVPLIEQFAKRYAGHSMVDDVLFWAGDLYHRRKRWVEAERYFGRIEALPEKGDQCGDARWRLAWMSYRRGQLKLAARRMQRLLERDGCVTARFDRARAHYWLGRIGERRGDQAPAERSYRAAFDAEPLGYYSQLAFTRLTALAPEAAAELKEGLVVPKAQGLPPLCPSALSGAPAFARGLELLLRGLGSDAALELLTIEMPVQSVVGSAHAASMGLAPKAATPLGDDKAAAAACGPHDARLLLALLLDRAGVYGAAHWRLRTDFADVLTTKPTVETAPIWIAAYPLAYRDFVGAAEAESGVPSLLLQALCREESALDPTAVSWAGAYGLTQLLLSSAQLAGKLLTPKVEVHSGEELLDPALSARLGGALLGSLVRRYRGNAGLALAGYNASEANADVWWTRHAGEPFDEFEEEITIKETRGYVARVLKTWGTYRFLYAKEPPALPVADKLPLSE